MELMSMIATFFCSFEPYAVKAFKPGILDISKKTLDIICSNDESNVIYEIIDACKTFIKKVYNTLLEMGAMIPEKDSITGEINKYFEEADRKIIEAERKENEKQDLIRQIKARSELLDMFNSKK